MHKLIRKLYYNYLFYKTSRLLHSYDLCEFKTGKCKGSRLSNVNVPCVCCIKGLNIKSRTADGACKYLSTTGCTTKCLGCKLWFCSYVKIPEKISRKYQILLRKTSYMGFFTSNLYKE